MVDAATGAPVPNAFIEFLDTNLTRSAGAIGNDVGQFALSLESTGDYRARVQRIGYETWVSSPFSVGPEGQVLRLEITVEPVPLPELRVTTTGACDGTEADRFAAAELYRTASEALGPLVWTEAQDLFVFQVAIEESGPERTGLGVPITLEAIESLPDHEKPALDPRRPDDPHAYVVLPAPPDTVLVRQPLVTLDARYLAELGFVQPWADVGLRYFAPTAATLVSQPFRETHCFSVARNDETGEVGLAFAPLPERRTADIEGVLWLDPKGDPRQVEFRFTRLEELLRRHEVPALVTTIRDRVRSLRSAADARVSFGRTVMDGEFGGELQFEELDTGIWITRHWELRIPIMWHTATWTRGTNSQILEVSGQPIALERRRAGTVTALLAPEAIADDSTVRGLPKE